MVVADIKKLPTLGEYAVMDNAVHGEREKLKCVGYIPDDEIEALIHVLFASDDETDNIHEHAGIRYYCIRTYASIEE